jgi:hypothetical protein
LQCSIVIGTEIMSESKPFMESLHSPALVVNITVMRNMLAGCQIVVGNGLTDDEIGDAEAAAVMELFKETYGRRRAVEADEGKPDPDRAIAEAMRAIELAGAHPALTSIVVALEAAQRDYRTYRDAETGR